MKIADVECVMLRGSGDQGIYGAPYGAVVKVTAEGGLVGYGEADSHPRLIKAVVEAEYHNELMSGLKPLLVGRDPLDTEARWADMARGTLNFARDGVTVQAMAAVDIALWDIKGKALAQPVHQLLGGARRDSLAFYATHPLGATLAETARFAAALRDRGLPAVKFGWHPLGPDAEMDTQIVRTLRRTLGPDLGLLIDGGMAYDASSAIDRCRRFAEYDVFWFEEALPAYDIDGYARLNAAVDMRICAGEMASTLEELARLIEGRCVDVLQVDLSRVGLTQAMKVAALAERHGVACVNHTYTLDFNLAASLHFAAAIARTSLFEYQVTPNEIRDVLVTNRPEPSNGRIPVPQGPGLGVEVDEEALARFAIP